MSCSVQLHGISGAANLASAEVARFANSEDPHRKIKPWSDALLIRACSHVCRFCTCADLAHI
jgi:hypothetical protein